MAVFHPGLEFIQRPGWWSECNLSMDVKMPVVAWADKLIDIRVPRDVTAQVCANIRKDSDSGFIIPDGEHPVTGYSIFPSVDLPADKTKKGRNANLDLSS